MSAVLLGEWWIIGCFVLKIVDVLRPLVAWNVYGGGLLRLTFSIGFLAYRTSYYFSPAYCSAEPRLAASIPRRSAKKSLVLRRVAHRHRGRRLKDAVEQLDPRYVLWHVGISGAPTAALFLRFVVAIFRPLVQIVVAVLLSCCSLSLALAK